MLARAVIYAAYLGAANMHIFRALEHSCGM